MHRGTDGGWWGMSERGRECGGKQDERRNGATWATERTLTCLVNEVGRVWSMGIT